jgi:hypothetical protein
MIADMKYKKFVFVGLVLLAVSYPLLKVAVPWLTYFVYGFFTDAPI